MALMRAKLMVMNVTPYPAEGEKQQEQIQMTAVAASSYSDDGADEDNTYARWSPSAGFDITIANPALFGKFHIGQKFYVDFTEAEQ